MPDNPRDRFARLSRKARVGAEISRTDKFWSDLRSFFSMEEYTLLSSYPICVDLFFGDSQYGSSEDSFGEYKTWSGGTSNVEFFGLKKYLQGKTDLLLTRPFGRDKEEKYKGILQGMGIKITDTQATADRKYVMLVIDPDSLVSLVPQLREMTARIEAFKGQINYNISTVTEGTSREQKEILSSLNEGKVGKEKEIKDIEYIPIRKNGTFQEPPPPKSPYQSSVDDIVELERAMDVARKSRQPIKYFDDRISLPLAREILELKKIRLERLLFWNTIKESAPQDAKAAMVAAKKEMERLISEAKKAGGLAETKQSGRG